MLVLFIIETWSEVIGFNLFFNFCFVILYLEKLNQIRLNKRNINLVNHNLKNVNIKIDADHLTFFCPYKNQIFDVNRENILENLKKYIMRTIQRKKARENKIYMIIINNLI